MKEETKSKVKGSASHRLYSIDREHFEVYLQSLAGDILKSPAEQHLAQNKFDYRCNVCSFCSSVRDLIEKHAIETQHEFATKLRTNPGADIATFQVKDSITQVASPDDFNFMSVLSPFH